jgi:hypothetical protein
LNEGVDWGTVGLAKEALASGRVRPVAGLGAGGGCAVGLGTAIARGALGVGFTAGVSGAFGEPLCGLGDFSLAVFFFFFDFGEVSLLGLFFGFGWVVGSGVSLGVGDASVSSLGVFFFFGFGDGDGDFFFLCGEVFGFAVGVGDSSEELTARAFRIRGDFSSPLCCA